MKRLYALVICLLGGVTAFSQVTEHLYLVTGNKIEGQIVSVEEERVKCTIDGGKTYYGGRDKILIAFNKIGNYLVVKDISTDINQAQRQIDAFYKETIIFPNTNDILLKALPQEVIACTIKNELADAVNYLNIEGKPASINKDNLFAIIRRDGTHNLLRDISEVIDNLSSMAPDFQRLRVQKKTVEPPKPIIKPPVTSSEDPKPTVPEKKQLTLEEQRIYKAKSQDKMMQLATYLNEIVDKSRSRSEKDESIRKALQMFTKEAKIDVTAINNPNNKTTRSVEEYLGKLSRLSYSNISITYADIKFVEDFEPDDQGNFWGMASYAQTFKNEAFTDVTIKRQKVKLQRYRKIESGVTQDKFDILLGNISVDVKQ